MKPVFVHGTAGPGSNAPLEPIIRKTFLDATDNCSWLKKDDLVLIKPALNSPDPYPATTHPLAIRTVAAVLRERGARVVIGDQSGIEHVLHHKDGVIRGSSRGNYTCSGMGELADPFVAFEEGGWDEGFFHYQSRRKSSWKAGFYLTRQVQEADHIICLPRVSSHSQAGATLGMKCMVGLLREDSRMEFHANGPFNQFIKNSAKGSTLVSRDDGSGKFLEKIVEISDAVRDKLRATLFVATRVQATFGPDRYTMRIGPLRLGKAYVAAPDPGLVFASADPVAAEAFALAYLKHLKASVPLLPALTERVLLSGNPYVRTLTEDPVRHHPFIRHAEKIGLGRMPEKILWADVPASLQESIDRLLNPGKTG
jgi:uncharacterized protein (DUF362 family)